MEDFHKDRMGLSVRLNERMLVVQDAEESSKKAASRACGKNPQRGKAGQKDMNYTKEIGCFVLFMDESN
ncbi:MAG: hypothetical protein PHD67_02945 [Oscillospiraceae bacterium]|nr:hypothetical protein [Oscillospiraceae bacterium]